MQGNSLLWRGFCHKSYGKAAGIGKPEKPEPFAPQVKILKMNCGRKITFVLLSHFYKFVTLQKK